MEFRNGAWDDGGKKKKTKQKNPNTSDVNLDWS